MSYVISSQTLANGLRQDFWDTYKAVSNRQSDGRLGKVMDLSVPATNRKHEFAYYKAAPHMTFWRRGTPIPTDAMDSVQFEVDVWEFAKRVPWYKFDRFDDQTSSLFDMAKETGSSAALLEERIFFDLITNNTATLPGVPLAPDGAAMYATTAGGANRFGVANGNLLTGTGVASLSTILTDYYSALEQFMLMQDGKGQPLHSPETVASGAICIFGAANTHVFEQAFLQLRQGVVLGTDAGTTPSNVVKDASRTTELWASPRITDNSWYVFLLNPPKKATFILDRSGVVEESALEGDQNSDSQRTNAIEYIQWYRRLGGGISLPYQTIKVSN